MLTLSRRTLIGTSAAAFLAQFASTRFALAADGSEAVLVLNPNEAGATYELFNASSLSAAATLIYDTLVLQDADTTIHPKLAESWTTSADGMEWVFNLRKGVKFHDGEDLTAETIVWWLGQYKGKENEYLIDAIETVEIIDTHSVRFVMNRAEPNLLQNLATAAMGIPSPKAVAELGDSYGITGAVGTGAYKFESFVPSQETVLVRNDDYAWGSDLSTQQGPAGITRLTFREIAENSTAFLELKTGGVDMLMAVPTEFLAEVAAIPSVEVHSIPAWDLIFLAINTSKPVFNDFRVRQAVALAVNQQDILDNIYGGVGTVAKNFLPPALAESNIDPALNISFDAAKANALLEEAGWILGTDGVRKKDGAQLDLNLTTEAETELKRIAEVVQAQLKAVGVQAKITTFDSSAIKDQLKTGAHDLAIKRTAWANADNLDWHFNGESLGYPNMSMWNDPKGEELRKIATQGSKTWDERVANFKAFHEYTMSQFVFAPIYHPTQNIAFNAARVTMPEQVRGVWFMGQTIVDMTVIG